MPHPYLAYHASEREQARIQDLLALLPAKGKIVLDIGARDGYISMLLAKRYDLVLALDQERPDISFPGIRAVSGDVTALDFEDNSIDAIVCAEVLEHIPPDLLERACNEIVRVASGTVIVGVPYRQDLRYGRTTCASCMKTSPPWGHLNSFDEAGLEKLFSALTRVEYSYVGTTRDRTNAVSAALMDFAGNPYGDYNMEYCVHCKAVLKLPAKRTLAQKIATRAALVANVLPSRFTKARPNWIHAHFEKKPHPAAEGA